MERKMMFVLLIFINVVVLLAVAIGLIFSMPPVTSIIMSIVVLLLSCILFFLQWALRPMKPTQDFVSTIEEEGLTLVKKRFGHLLQKKDGNEKLGIIFYPGGRILPMAYLPILKQIALKGFPVYLVKMPLNMAIFDYKRAIKIIDKHLEFNAWVIGGHSLGGAMAVHLVKRVPHKFKGVFLWGAYPSSKDDISDIKVPVLTVFGNCDGVTTIEKIDECRHLFPTHAQWECLDGGNHAQFGCYGIEKKDKPAQLSQSSQHLKVANITLTFINQVVWS